MPKNVLIPQDYAGGLLPPVPEQSIRFDRTRQTRLAGYSPPDSVGSDLWQVAFWMKQTGELGSAARTLFCAYIDANNFTRLDVDATGNLNFEARIAGVIRASFATNRRLMDTSNWFHIIVEFDRVGGNLDLYVNGYLWSEFSSAPSIDNVAGYAFQDSGADHIIGAFGTPSDWFSGEMAEFIGTGGSIQLTTEYATFNSIGVWTRKAPTFFFNARDFYLTFGRTADLGEDFSGNANDFTTHVNGGPTDQMDDWPERNYCIIDVNNDGTIGALTEAGLVLGGGGNGRVTMQPAANTGVWYYEKDGVGVTWDTGASGRFNPLLFAGSYNFGQLPFVGVGPGGGELTLCSPNMPASDVPISRDYFAAIGYEGDGVSPRTIAAPAISQGDAEYADIVHRTDLVWVRNMSIAVDQQQSHRLRAIPNQVLVNDIDLESATLPQGYVSDLLATGFEVTAGGSGDDNTNNTGDLISALSWRVSKYAQNIRVTSNDESDAEEQISTGDTDTGSSDLELGSEDGGSGSAEQAVGMQWKNLRIPQGAVIADARIQFECDAARNDQPNDLEIWCEDIDDAPEFVDGAANTNITGRTKTTASTLWSPAQWDTTQRRSSVERTVDFAPSVKEVVDRGGWAPGNDLAAIIINESGGTVGRHEAEPGNAGTPATANGPMLQVAWDDGGIDTGMSLFTYDGAGKVAEVMHGLGDVPEFIAIKRATGALDGWRCYHSLISATDLPAPEDGYIDFSQASAAVDNATIWNDTAPGATFLTLGANGDVNGHENEYIGWAMREVEGFSKLFSYTGDGSSNGAFIYCGFKPRMIIIKETGPGGNGWFFGHRAMGLSSPSNGIHNQLGGNLLLNSITAALQDDNLFIGSNGFHVIDSTGPINNNNSRYVGIAFAEAPFQSAKGAT